LIDRPELPSSSDVSETASPTSDLASR
jgi:hypothetical protein